MNDDKYYFVVYTHKKQDSIQLTQTSVKNQHPLDWQMECMEQYGHLGESYLVTNWKEISEDEYMRFKNYHMHIWTSSHA